MICCVSDKDAKDSSKVTFGVQEGGLWSLLEEAEGVADNHTICSSSH